MGYTLSSPLAKANCSPALKYTSQTMMVYYPRVEEMPHETTTYWDSFWSLFSFKLSSVINYLARNEAPSERRHLDLLSFSFFFFFFPVCASHFHSPFAENLL